jgi:hypothetical protein
MTNATVSKITSDLLTEVEQTVRRYVIVSSPQAAVISAWVLHTYVWEHAQHTPYLAVTSPEKRSGKTRLMEVLKLLVRRPLFASDITCAALFALIDTDKPTVFLDELDTVFHGDKEIAVAIKRLLNVGYEVGSKYYRRRERSAREVEIYEVFGPRCLAAIGKLPDTIADRCLPIRLRRRAPHEKVLPFFRREVDEGCKVLRARLAAWAEAAGPHLTWPERTGDLELINDRAFEVSWQLFGIADMAGAPWSDRIRKAVVELTSGDDAEDASIGVRLIGDTKGAIGVADEQAGAPVPNIPSADLLAYLVSLEEGPWAEFNKGKPVTARQVAAILRRYGVRPRVVRVGDRTPSGYRRSDLEDLWRRYLPTPQPPSSTRSTTKTPRAFALQKYPQQTRPC